MASFKTVLVKDSLIADVTPELTFGVQSGPASNTFQPFSATSASNSSVIFTCQIPSENILVDRQILISTGLTFQVTVSGAPNNARVCDYGLTCALGAFPFNSLLTTATCQINNANVSCALQDVLPSILRMTSTRDLVKDNGMSPSLIDCAYGRYSDAAGTLNNPMGDYSNGELDADFVPRGAHPVRVTIARYNAAGAYQDASPISTAADDVFKIVVQTHVCEPLMMSPFIFGDPEHNAQGLLGINNMTFTFNIDSGLKRLFSMGTDPAWQYAIKAGNDLIQGPAAGGGAGPVILAASGDLFRTATPVGVSNQVTTPRLLMRLISTQPSDLLQSKNVCSYTDVVRFITPSFNTSVVPASGASVMLNSSAIQLNQVPQLLFITCRKPMSLQTMTDSMSQLVIQGINISFNNASGLLSSATPYQLWKMSVRNGSTQSWAQFSGQASLKESQAGGASGNVRIIPTVGSVLIINPALDLSLPDYLSASSIGSYALSFQLSVATQFGADITPEICTVVANAGLFVTSQGQSSTFSGLLTKEQVLSAKSEKGPMTTLEDASEIGGKFHHVGFRKHPPRLAVMPPAFMPRGSKLDSLL